MAIWCPALAIDRWRLCQRAAEPHGTTSDDAPVILAGETAHGPRITATSAPARAAGARVGMLLADARALAPGLVVHPADPAGDRAFLESLALWAQRWGPWSALDPPDGVIVDVTGVAHLFGGEAALMADAQGACAARGLQVRLAIAPTAGAAWALAHHGPDRAALAAGADPVQALHALPVAALRLDDAVLLLLERLGLKRLGDLAGIDRAALARRFRDRRAPAANPLVRLDQFAGRVPEPILPVMATPLPLVQRRLLEPVRHRDLLDRVIADLAMALARRLEAQGQGARRVELTLWNVDGEVVRRTLELAAATRDPAHIARLFAHKLDDCDAGFGFEVVRLSAPWAEPLALTQADLDHAAQAHGTSLAACIDRLTVRLGTAAVAMPVPRASHVPERAQRWIAPDPAAVTQEELAFHARPLKLLDRAEPIAVIYEAPDGLPRLFRWRGAVHEITRAEGPERIAPEWWREKGRARLRDYFRIEDSSGRRFWIYRRGLPGDGRGGAPEWFLQGLCG
jgi:protein ImuB